MKRFLHIISLAFRKFTTLPTGERFLAVRLWQRAETPLDYVVAVWTGLFILYLAWLCVIAVPKVVLYAVPLCVVAAHLYHNSK